MYSFSFSNTSAPPYIGLFWLALAVTFGIRRPGGALLAGFALAVGPAVFHWIADSDLLGGGTASRAHRVDLLRADPVGDRRHPARTGARRHPLARRPAAAPEEAREGARGAASPRPRPSAHDGTVPDHEVLHTAAAPVAAPVAERRRARPGTTLAMNGIVAGYGDAEVLHGVSLGLESGNGGRVARGQRRREVDAVLGRRGTRRRDGRHHRARRRRHHPLALVPARTRAACCSSRKRAGSSRA